MYSTAKDTYVCDTCGFEQKWDAHDDHRGDIWECERCYTHFCTSCFVKALGQTEWNRMLGEMSEIYCPSCYGKEQVKDYMIFEEETSKQYPFPKRFEHLIPPTVRRYNVVIIEHRKKLVPVLAASWAEAEARVREMWENGEVVIGQSDFAGIMISSGG